MLSAYSCINIWMQCSQNYFSICPISDIYGYDTRQAKNKKLFASFKSTSKGQQSITYIGPHVWDFILSKMYPICSKKIIQKTYSSIITALFCVGFDVVITDIKTNTFSWPWPPCEYIYIYIYIHIDMHVLHLSICICMCVNSILFHLSHYLCPR